MRKIAITALFAIILGIYTSSLAFSIATTERREIPVFALLTAFAFYIFVFSASAVQYEGRAHVSALLHLCSLTLLATALLSIPVILPDTPYPIYHRDIAVSISVSDALWYSTVVLYAIAMAIVFTTPRSPGLHYPPEHIYTKVIASKRTSPYPDNVDESISKHSLTSCT